MKKLFAMIMMAGISLMLGSLFWWLFDDKAIHYAQIGFLVFASGFLLQKYHPKGAYHEKQKLTGVKQ